MLGPPAALALSLYAWIHGMRGPQAVAALALSGIEALVLAILLALALFGFFS